VVIPDDEPAGSEPAITLVMEGDGIEIRDTKTLLVEHAPRLSWNLNTEPVAHEGYLSSYRIDVTNTGNTDISHTLDVIAPSSWDARAIDGIRVVLSPGESRSIILEFTPHSGSDGIVSLNLINAPDTEGSTFEIPVDVKPSLGGDSGLEAYLPLILGTLLVAILAGLGTYTYVRTNGDPISLLKKKPTSRQSREQEDLDSVVSGVPCWICSTDTIIGNSWACSSCGARYHKIGQVTGCDIVSLGRCLHCDAEVDDLVEA
jgi:hypothetical protein